MIPSPCTAVSVKIFSSSIKRLDTTVFGRVKGNRPRESAILFLHRMPTADKPFRSEFSFSLFSHVMIFAYPTVLSKHVIEMHIVGTLV